jgi:hypothetical protein
MSVEARKIPGGACLAALALVAAVAEPGYAQQTVTDPAAEQSSRPATKLPGAALFATAGAKNHTAPLDSVIQAALAKLDVVDVRARPGMDLNAVQLAIDCVSESPQCLRAVAAESGAQILIAPALESTGSELVLSLLLFDTRDGQMRRVVRRQPGGSLQTETLDAVPGMLRELFGLPEPTPAPPQPLATPEEPESTPVPLIEPPQEPESVSHPTPIGPVILAGAGALVLVGGVVAGVMMNSTQEEYNQLSIRDEADVDEAHELKDRAETQATVANVLYAVGGAALVAGSIWLTVELTRPARTSDDWQAALEPRIGPGQLGLSLVGRGGGL